MLAGVLLHVVEAARPVDFRLHVRARRHGPVGVVEERAVRLVAAGDRDGAAGKAERAGVARLAAGVGEKDRLVEREVVARLRRRAGEHARAAAGQVAVFEIQASGHGGPLSGRGRGSWRTARSVFVDWHLIIAQTPRQWEKFPILYFLWRMRML